MIFASELFYLPLLNTFAYLLASCGFSWRWELLNSDRQLESRADAEERTDGNLSATQIFDSATRGSYHRDFAISLRFIFRFSSRRRLSTQSPQSTRGGTRKQTADAVSYVLKFVIQRLKILTRLKKLFFSFSLLFSRSVLACEGRLLIDPINWGRSSDVTTHFVETKPLITLQPLLRRSRKVERVTAFNKCFVCFGLFSRGVAAFALCVVIGSRLQLMQSRRLAADREST